MLVLKERWLACRACTGLDAGAPCTTVDDGEVPDDHQMGTVQRQHGHRGDDAGGDVFFSERANIVTKQCHRGWRRRKERTMVCIKEPRCDTNEGCEIEERNDKEERHRSEKRRQHPAGAQTKTQKKKMVLVTVLRHGGAPLVAEGEVGRRLIQGRMIVCITKTAMRHKRKV